MKVGSTFSGIGAFDLGFEQAGFEIAWQVEIDKRASGVLERHWPNVERYDDIRNLRNPKPVDVLIGGFPCQDLSVAGRRKGLAGERSGLWFEFHRILGELRPQWTVIENVPGLLSSNGGQDFAIVLRGLVELGYGVAWRVLDAQYFGVAQRRRRVFIVGSFGDGRAAEILFEPESMPGNPPPSKKAGEEPARVAGTLAASGGGTERPAGNGNELDFCIPVAKTLAYTTTYDHMDHTQQNYIPVMGAITDGTEESDSREGNRILAFGGNKTSGPQDVAPSLLAHGGTGRHDFASETFVAFSAGNSGSSYGIGASENVAPPVRSTASGTNQAPTVTGFFGVRRLTPLECERLQGLPDGWTDGQPDGPRYAQIGNAVAVPVARWIARRIYESNYRG